jgi:hypothetical protein
LASAVLFCSSPAFAGILTTEPEAAPAETPGRNLYAEHFYAPSGQKLDLKVSGVRGFPVIKTRSRPQNAEYSIVTDFGGGALRSRFLPGLKDIKAIDEYIKKNLQVANFEGVEIRKLPLPLAGGGTSDLFWVGDKAFPTAAQATAEVTRVKSRIESQGGNFAKSVQAVPVFVAPEKPEPVKTKAQYQKEEELVLKFADQLDLGEKMWGPFQGEPAGEPVLWQSFGETTYRMTNLENRNFNSQVGYWTNRIVLKGIRAPLSTIDPFFEETTTIEAVGADYKSHFDIFAGFEWRPFARNPWLYNFRPFGWDIPLLEWVRNYKFYIKYGNRYNIKDEIQNAKDYDLVAGVQIFYEWGTELPPLDEGKPERFADYLRQYVWGEYFGDYRWHKTDFSEMRHFNAWILNSSVIMGIKLPAIPLPHNPINDELVLMPYLRFEHTSNDEYSYHYQNQYYLAPGIRWMPFRSYRWKEDEWLSKIAIFGEWLAIGKVQHSKQDGEAPDAIRYDLRFGMKFSHRRF